MENSVQGSPSSTLPSPTQQEQPQRAPMYPNESFVLLQDSGIRTIPSNLPATSHAKKPSFLKARSTTAAVPPTPAPDEPPHSNPSPLSHHLRSSSRLFNLLSSRTDLDHPLCAECTHILLAALTRQLEETKEGDGYIAFEKEARKEKEREGSTGTSKAERLKDEERLVVEQLKAAERERQQLGEELKSLEREEKALEEEEAEFWRQHNAHLLKSASSRGQTSTMMRFALVTMEYLG